MLVVHLGNGGIDIVSLPAQFVENERRRLVQLDGAGQRKDHVFGANRIAGGKLGIGKFEGQAAAIAAGRPGRGKRRLDLGAVFAVRLD